MNSTQQADTTANPTATAEALTFAHSITGKGSNPDTYGFYVTPVSTVIPEESGWKYFLLGATGEGTEDVKVTAKVRNGHQLQQLATEVFNLTDKVEKIQPIESKLARAIRDAKEQAGSSTVDFADKAGVTYDATTNTLTVSFPLNVMPKTFIFGFESITGGAFLRSSDRKIISPKEGEGETVYRNLSPIIADAKAAKVEADAQAQAGETPAAETVASETQSESLDVPAESSAT